MEYLPITRIAVPEALPCIIYRIIYNVYYIVTSSGIKGAVRAAAMTIGVYKMK